MSGTTSPLAPGSLGEAIDPTLLLQYLTDLQQWLGERRRELDAIDAAIRAGGPQAAAQRTAGRMQQQAQMTADIMLSMALWQACQNRTELLLATWDCGRVGIAERQKLSALIWGRLDTTVQATAATTFGGLSGMNLSLPEACRLSDALAGSLRSRLELDPDTDEIIARLKAVRATLERLRDQVKLEPATTFETAQRQLAELTDRLQIITDKHTRGGDIGGLLGPLELEANTFERDLIVGGTLRRRNQAKVEQACERLAELRLREEALTKLVRQTVAAVVPAPKYAVPAVAALGEVPAGAEIDVFLTRLDHVSRAMQVVQTAYSQALAEKTGLVERLKALPDLESDPEFATVKVAAQRVLGRTPTPLITANALVGALEAWSASTSKEQL